jgi:hypothetical protein
MSLDADDTPDLENANLDGAEIPEYGSTDDTRTLSNAGEGGDVEAQARALGWVPEDEYTGNPSKWADAETFLEVHARNNGSLRKAVAKQADELAELRRQMQGMDAAHKRIFDLQIKKQKDEFDQQIAFLKAQKKEALRAGEHETAADIDDLLDSLRERGPELPDLPEGTSPKTTPQAQDWRKNPTLVEWAGRNPWFEKDEDMSAYAGGMGQQIRNANPDMPFEALLEEVTKRVKRAFPQKFAAGRRNPVEGATPGATGGAGAGRNSYEALPREAKQACDEAVAEGGITRKQWVELYHGYDDRRKR